MAAVLAGGFIGLIAQSATPPAFQELSKAAIGIGVICMGIKMFLGSRNVLVPIAAMVFGGMLGHLLGIHAGVMALGDWAKQATGAKGDFQESFVLSSILFCVGPMTLLGCLEEGLEGKIELLGLKSLLDGISSIFFAATAGPGVLLSAGTVLLVQGPLTLCAKKLAVLKENVEMLGEVTATGGMILVAIGLGLLELKSLTTADYVMALPIAAGITFAQSRVRKK